MSRPASLGMTEKSGSRVRYWLLGFAVVQIICQLALLSETLGSLRVVWRSVSFGISLVALVWVSGAKRQHPSARWVTAALAVLALGLFHPTTNGPMVGLAQIALYTAIAAPIYWVPRLPVDRDALVKLIALLWLFETTSAAFGVLQVRYPGRFMPAVSDVVESNAVGIEAVSITLADGSRIPRPMGLTDRPGGAAGAGVAAVLFGIGFLIAVRKKAVQLAAAGSVVIGLFCIYLSQVRAALVVAVITAGAFMVMLAWIKRTGDAVRLLVIAAVLAVASFSWAVAVGGTSMTDRMASLIQSSPQEVYSNNRGFFLFHTVGVLLPQYPLGAGLGRWGMARRYFGDPSNVFSGPIWVEIQWTGWLLDGGLPLVVLYGLAVLVAGWSMVEVARRTPDPALAGWAALIAAYDLATLARTFSYVPFIGQSGMEFWLLNAAVWTAWRNSSAAAAVRKLPGGRR